LPWRVETLLREEISRLGNVCENGITAFDLWHACTNLHESIIHCLQTIDGLWNDTTKHNELELRVIEAAVFVANAWFLHDNEDAVDVLHETAEVHAILHQIVVFALPFIFAIIEFNKLSKTVVLDFEASWQFDAQRETNKVAFIKDRIRQLNAEHVRNRVRIRRQRSHFA